MVEKPVLQAGIPIIPFSQFPGIGGWVDEKNIYGTVQGFILERAGDYFRGIFFGWVGCPIK